MCARRAREHLEITRQPAHQGRCVIVLCGGIGIILIIVVIIVVIIVSIIRSPCVRSFE